MDSRLPNRAFVFIKPHAAVSEQVIAYVQEALEGHGLDIINHGVLTGADIARGGIADLHYATIAEFGALMEPADLPMGDQEQERFLEAFGTEWDPALVRNAVQFGAETGLSAEEQNSLWEDSRYAKMGPGLYMSRLQPSGSESRIVVNGFYPSLKGKLTRDDAKIVWFDTRFNPDILSWGHFRADVIGSTHPGHASPESIRGRLYRFPELYGLQERPTIQQNGVHASAGPLEAARERLIWLGPATKDDPLLGALLARGMEEPRILALLENPVLLDGEDRRPAFDVLEDRDTDDALTVLLANLEQGIV